MAETPISSNEFDRWARQLDTRLAGIEASVREVRDEQVEQGKSLAGLEERTKLQIEDGVRQAKNTGAGWSAAVSFVVSALIEGAKQSFK